MPRRSRRAQDAPKALMPMGSAREQPIVLESGGHPEGRLEIRRIPRLQATKTYRCPGCDHPIGPGVDHVVVVPQEDPAARRHWHSRCWNRERSHRETAARRRR